MADISSKKDVEHLIDVFYSKLLMIDEMKPSFEGLDFQKHVPHIVHFWSFVLLDEPGYKTNVFEKHRHLPITPPLFDKWVETFNATVDSLFTGKIADLAKQRATVLGYTFKSKWESLNK